MTMIHAGVVPGRRMVLYGALGAVTTMVVCGAIVTGFGVGWSFTGLLAGVGAGIALLVTLFGRDAVVLTEQAIYRHTPWTRSSIDWERVVAGRFTLDERAHWSLALDLTGGDEPHGELILLSIPPVIRPVGNAYELRKREQVTEIREMLRHKRIPVIVLPEIAGALQQHWRLSPPTH